MNNDVTRTGNEPAWALAPYASGTAVPHAEERAYTPGADLNLAALIRIISEWRWLILSAIALGFAGASSDLADHRFTGQRNPEANPLRSNFGRPTNAQAVGPSVGISSRPVAF